MCTSTIVLKAHRRSVVLMVLFVPLALGQTCSPLDPSGGDGQRSVYGDGSAGDVVVATAKDLLDIAPNGNAQFRHLTVASTGTLTVPSGAVIRCSSTFTNNGSIVVIHGAQTDLGAGIPAAGISGLPAEPADVGDGSATVYGGAGGDGIYADVAAFYLTPNFIAGGAGGSSSLGLIGGFGGDGGGEVIVLAQGAMTNSGQIRADGETSSGGGGGGGIIILASPTSIANTGSISAKGGDGSHAGGHFGACGGGGGGIVHLISPSLAAGIINVNGGAGGAAGTVPAGNRASGAGGGGCGGSGGYGGAVSANPVNTAAAGTAGSVGYSIQTLADPTAMFW